MNKREISKRGFTLIELLVVIAVIAIIASLVIIRITSTMKDARIARRNTDVHEIKKAFDQFIIAGGLIQCIDPSCATNQWYNLSDSTIATMEADQVLVRTPGGKLPNDFMSGGKFSQDVNPDAPYKFFIEKDSPYSYLIISLSNSDNVIASVQDKWKD
ncbi:hypothetical protein CO152_00800 [bacterium CG_4_9_14_3_um_filter_33_26]|nr:MAG: hypothetical protein COY76_03015 [bacterium CG_4_10_14_0_8_um_filter_33_57]PJA72563.1 MAG: hypothetical protein CO152_00800 [bacterium CG_4_9_14_3_um_filter_33_26]